MLLQRAQVLVVFKHLAQHDVLLVATLHGELHATFQIGQRAEEVFLVRTRGARPPRLLPR